jgi:hypothetical protein
MMPVRKGGRERGERSSMVEINTSAEVIMRDDVEK